MTRRLPSSGRDHTGNEQLDRIWQAIGELERQINDSPMARGRLLTEEEGAVPGSGLAFSSSVTRSIPHGLGRRARGFLEVYGADMVSGVHVGLRAVAPLAGAPSDTHITVRSASTGTCFIWVF